MGSQTVTNVCFRPEHIIILNFKLCTQCNLHYTTTTLTILFKREQQWPKYRNVRFCTAECASEQNGYGYTVTTTGVTVGSTATYTCWPGYDYVSGDTSRECLSSLVWSGQRPTCQRACNTVYPQYCRNCKFNWNSLVYKCQYTQPVVMPSESCAALIQESEVFSAYFRNGECLSSDCDINIDDIGNSAFWTFTHSCFDRKFTIFNYFLLQEIEICKTKVFLVIYCDVRYIYVSFNKI